MQALSRTATASSPKPSLESLRNEVTQAQRALLDEIWNQFQANGEWPEMRTLYSVHDKRRVVELLTPLGASILWEQEDSQRWPYSQLTLLGALLTTGGDRFESLLIRFLEFEQRVYKKDPKKRHHALGEVATELGLQAGDAALLGQLLWLGHCGGSIKKDGGNWAASVLSEAEDFTGPDSLRSYLEEWVLRGYRRDSAVFIKDRRTSVTTSSGLADHINPSLLSQFDGPRGQVNADPFKRRYQVFVSSTYEDLILERQAVMHALLELDCIPSGMELFPAADDDQWTLIKRVIEDCDYYIVIIAGRYGSTSPSGLSYTQMEYEYAISRGKPVIAFLHKDPPSIQFAKTEQTDEARAKLAQFRAVAQQKVCKYWTTPDELGSVVSRSLVQLIKTKPAVGWVRGNLVTDESSAQEILRLRRALDDLQKATPEESARRPSPRPADYFLKLAEIFPRNAIQEAWDQLEDALDYALATNSLALCEDFSTKISALKAHGEISAAQQQAIVELYRVAYRARQDPAFQLTSIQAVEQVEQMQHLWQELVHRCDSIWKLRQAFPAARGA